MILLVVVDVIVSMKMVKLKEFVVFWTWRRIEADSNHGFYDIPETFSAIRLGVEVSKLHVRSCVCHLKN